MPVVYASLMATFVLLVLLAFWGPPTGGAPLPPTQPAAGRVLIANPQLVDPGFGHSVVLLLAYSDHGAMGLMLNRPTQVSLARLLPEELRWEDPELTVYRGGPVESGELRLLVRSATTPAGAVGVLPQVYLAADLTTLHRLRERELSPSDVRAYAGYAGWAPGQLEQEIARGDWSLGHATASIVFEQRPERLWPRLIKQWGGLWARDNPGPGDSDLSGDRTWTTTL